VKCPKCKASSGDDWTQCGGVCPMPMSPYYKSNQEVAMKYTKIKDEKYTYYVREDVVEEFNKAESTWQKIALSHFVAHEHEEIYKSQVSGEILVDSYLAGKLK
jgi:uncharacterized protein (UPF0264 family)